jgi:hypothetical protein
MSQRAAVLHDRMPGDWLHPRLIRTNGETGDIYPAALKMDEEQHVGHRPAQRQHLCAEEVGPCQQRQVSPNEGGPRGRALALRRRRQPVAVQDIANRLIGRFREHAARHGSSQPGRDHLRRDWCHHMRLRLQHRARRGRAKLSHHPRQRRRGRGLPGDPRERAENDGPHLRGREDDGRGSGDAGTVRTSEHAKSRDIGAGRG